MTPAGVFDELLRVFEDRRFEVRDDLPLAIEGLPQVEAMPSPWDAWAIIHLICCRQKQLRVAEVVAGFLGPEWRWQCGRAKADEAAYEAFCQLQSEWELLSLGPDLFLEHVETGELTPIDIVYGPEVINRSWLDIQMSDEVAAERRMRELFPEGRGLDLATDGLMQAGLIDAVDENNFELSERLKRCAGQVASFVAAWEDPDSRVWLGPLINDWPAAYEAARLSGDTALATTLAARAELCRELRRGMLRQRVAGSGLSPDLLHCLAVAGAAEVPAYLEEALREPTEVTAAALDLIQDDPSWCPRVHRLFQSLRRGSTGFLNSIPQLSAEYLARHDYHAQEVIETLWSSLSLHGRAAVLALQHRTDLALPLVRAVLKGDEFNREMVAAALAVIDQPWSRRELTSVLDASAQHETTLEVRMALRASQSYEARLAAEAWEREHLKPAKEAAPGRAGASPDSGPPPPSRRDEQSFRRWMERLRPLLSDVESPTPFTDILGE